MQARTTIEIVPWVDKCSLAGLGLLSGATIFLDPLNEYTVFGASAW